MFSWSVALPRPLPPTPSTPHPRTHPPSSSCLQAPLTPVPEELTSEHVEPAQPPAPPAALTQPEVEPIKLEPAFDAAAQAEKQPEPTFVESAAAALAAAVPDMLAKLSPAGPSMDIDAAPSEFGASEADLSVVDGPTGQVRSGGRACRALRKASGGAGTKACQLCCCSVHAPPGHAAPWHT